MTRRKLRTGLLSEPTGKLENVTCIDRVALSLQETPGWVLLAAMAHGYEQYDSRTSPQHPLSFLENVVPDRYKMMSLPAAIAEQT